MPDRPHAREGGSHRPALLPVGLARVRGDSMRPTLRADDLVLVTYGSPVRPGRLVLARFADGTLAVKRAVGRRAGPAGEAAWWLLSDDPGAGVDSRHRGPIPHDRVIAVVRARLWPWPRPLRRTRSATASPERGEGPL